MSAQLLVESFVRDNVATIIPTLEGKLKNHKKVHIHCMHSFHEQCSSSQGGLIAR